MKFLIELGLEDIRHLPEHIRQQIQANLGLAPAPVQQPVYQSPAPQQFAPVQPQAFQAPPAVMPTKQPIVENGKLTFPPDKGHFSQQSVAVDVMTGQPVPIGAPQTPAIPQMMAAPVNVAPVSAPAPQHVAPPVPQADVQFAKGMAIRAYNNPTIDGKAILAKALAETGLDNIAGLNDGNAGTFVSRLQQYGVS